MRIDQPAQVKEGTIQLLMGHERLEDTTIYLHLSQRHLHAAINPLDQLTLRNPQEEQQG